LPYRTKKIKIRRGVIDKIAIHKACNIAKG